MNKYLEKVAKFDAKDPEFRKEVRDTGVIGAIGAGTGLVGAKLLAKSPGIAKSNVKTMALMGGLGLAGDFAAVKINKYLNKSAEQSVASYKASLSMEDRRKYNTAYDAHKPNMGDYASKIIHGGIGAVAGAVLGRKAGLGAGRIAARKAVFGTFSKAKAGQAALKMTDMSQVNTAYARGRKIAGTGATMGEAAGMTSGISLGLYNTKDFSPKAKHQAAMNVMGHSNAK